MCAGVAAKRGKRVVVIDHAEQPGKKILISGGGRCNFTNRDMHAERFLSSNPHFAKSALARYTAADFIALVDAHNIAWHEKTLGQLFCDGSAKQIVDMLMTSCAGGGAEVRLGQSITSIRHRDGNFTVTTSPGAASQATVVAPALVLATGGPSIPKMGATGFAYEVARQFDLDVITPRPALVPLTLGDEQAPFRALTGVAFEAVVSVGKTAFREAALFTHKGMSGPAVLQVSSYWHPGDQIVVNFLPEAPAELLLAAKRARPKAKLQQVLASSLPKRLADVLGEQLNVRSEFANIPDLTLDSIDARLRHWSFQPTGSEGYAKAEVTAGGIATSELSSKDMQATKVPGLYCIGEAVDVTGWLGGYNFQWAWASGFVAGEAV